MESIAERAKSLTAQLKADIGDLPFWKEELTLRELQEGETEETLREEYKIMFNNYNEHRPRARELFKNMKGEFGRCSSISEQTVLEWMNKKWTDDDIRVEYERVAGLANASQLHADELLAGLIRDMGECGMVGKRDVRKWIANGLTDDNIRTKYQWKLEQASLASRAERLQPRLVEQFGDDADTSIPALLRHFQAGRTDDDILTVYREIGNQARVGGGAE